MRKFTVSHAGRDGLDPFSPYLFDVFSDGIRVAELGHDYRGNEHWIRVPGGEWIDLPARVIKGGGPNLPLTLSAAGENAVEHLTGK